MQNPSDSPYRTNITESTELLTTLSKVDVASNKLGHAVTIAEIIQHAYHSKPGLYGNLVLRRQLKKAVDNGYLSLENSRYSLLRMIKY